MKKLIMLSAVLTICTAPQTGVSASDDDRVAQVYDITVSVKTTQAKRGKVLSSANPFVDDSGKILYRKQTTEKWTGLVWGCECEAVLGVWQTMPEGGTSGVALWKDSKPNDIVLLDDMRWHVLNAIDVKGDKVESAWTIGESTDDSSAFLAFSGFGTLALSTERADGNLVLDGCGSYLSSARGNVVGWTPGPLQVTTGRAAVCTFCGVIDEGEEDSIDVAEAWIYCPCAGLDTTELTAVSGTWSIKYNKQLSKKLKNADSIVDVYKFPASVKGKIEARIKEFEDGE